MNYTQPEITVVNKKVACRPLVTSIQKSGNTFVTVKQKTNLVATCVVFGNETFRTGTFVYLRGDVITMPWAKEIYDLGGHQFILIPEDIILMMSEKNLSVQETP